MATDDDKKDPTVKELVAQRDKPLEQLVDAQTAEQLARWFGLPSFAQVEAGEARAPIPGDPDYVDPEIAQIAELRRKLLEQLDPILLAGLERRRTPPPDLLKFTPSLEPFQLRISVCTGDVIEGGTLGEPREYQRSEDIDEALTINTPQALLRDLHRSERDPSQVSASDMWMNPGDEPPRERPFDHKEVITEVMGANYKIELDELPDPLRVLDDFVIETRTMKWSDLPKRLPMPNRRIEEGR